MKKQRHHWEFIAFCRDDNCDVCRKIIETGRKGWVHTSGISVCHGCKTQCRDKALNVPRFIGDVQS